MIYIFYTKLIDILNNCLHRKILLKVSKKTLREKGFSLGKLEQILEKVHFLFSKRMLYG